MEYFGLVRVDRTSDWQRSPICPSAAAFGHYAIKLYATGFRRLAELAVGVEHLDFMGLSTVDDNGLKSIGKIDSLKNSCGTWSRYYRRRPDPPCPPRQAGRVVALGLRGHSRPGLCQFGPDQIACALKLSVAALDTETLRALASLVQLEELALQAGAAPAGFLQAADFQFLNTLKNLQTFVIALPGPADDKKMLASGTAILSVASTLPSLRKLTAFNIIADGGGLAALANAPHLEELTLFKFVLSEQDLSSLGALVHLKKLTLIGNSEVPEAAWAKLASMRQLTMLAITGGSLENFDDTALRHLASLDRLESLTVPGRKITGTGLAALANLKQLKTLRLTGCAHR